MRGFLSDHGAKTLKNLLNHSHRPHEDCSLHLNLSLILSVQAGWNYAAQGKVKRQHEPTKLMREVATEILTGVNYWSQADSPVERLFNCRSAEELRQVANDLTNGYINKGK